MCGGQPQSDPGLSRIRHYTMFIPNLHPRDKRACLPKIPSSHSNCALPKSCFEVKLKKYPKFLCFSNKNFCIFKIIQIFAFYCRENLKTLFKMAVKLNLDKLDL